MAQNWLSPGAPDSYGTETPLQSVLRKPPEVFASLEEKPSVETMSPCTHLPEPSSKGVAAATSQGMVHPGARKTGGCVDRGSPGKGGGREAGAGLHPTGGHGDALGWEVGTGGSSQCRSKQSPVGGRARACTRLTKSCQQQERCFNSTAATQGRRWPCPARSLGAVCI